MGIVKFNDGDFYLNGQYIGSGKMTEKIVNPKDARIKFLEEQLIHERAKSEKFLHVLNEYESVFKTPAEMKNYVDKSAELSIKMTKLRQEAITIDMVEKAAYDVVQSYIKSGDSHRSDAWAVTSSDALVAVLATRMTERIKQYAEKY